MMYSIRTLEIELVKLEDVKSAYERYSIHPENQCNVKIVTLNNRMIDLKRAIDILRKAKDEPNRRMALNCHKRLTAMESTNKDEWVPVTWSILDTKDRDTEDTTIERIPRHDGPCRYSVRRRGCCLNKKLEFEHEFLPSARTKAFLKRCRFDTFEEAVEVFNKYREKEGKL